MAAEQKMLISANVILDTDIGLIKLIQFHYRNTDIFLNEVLDSFELELQQYLLYTRDIVNPLSVVTRKEYWDNIAELYTQFMELEYDRIVDLSCNTDLLEVLKIIILSSGIGRSFDVLCSTEHEAKVLETRLSKIGTKNYDIILEPNRKKVDMGKYSEIYLKYANELDDFKIITKKSIFISDHRLNMVKDETTNSNVFDLEYAIKYIDHNNINTFSMYSFRDFIPPVG